MKEAVSGMQQKKDGSGGRDTLRLQLTPSHLRPVVIALYNERSCASQVAEPRGLLGVVVQGGRGGPTLEDVEWAVTSMGRSGMNQLSGLH